MDAGSGLRIESDGTTEGTHVFLDDVEVQRVTNVTWTFSPSKRKTLVTLEISNVAIMAAAEPSEATRAALRAITETLE